LKLYRPIWQERKPANGDATPGRVWAMVGLVVNASNLKMPWW